MAELIRRYLIMPLATEMPFDLADPDGAFVLKPWKDPAALRALAAYRDNCYPALARDLDAWIKTIKAGPVVRGGVGKRNEAYLQPEPARTRTRTTPRVRVGSKAARPVKARRKKARAKKGRGR